MQAASERHRLDQATTRAAAGDLPMTQALAGGWCRRYPKVTPHACVGVRVQPTTPTGTQRSVRIHLSRVLHQE